MDFNSGVSDLMSRGTTFPCAARLFPFSLGKANTMVTWRFFLNYPIGPSVQLWPDKTSQRRRGIVALKQAVLGRPEMLILQGFRLPGGTRFQGFALPPGFLHLWG